MKDIEHEVEPEDIPLCPLCDQPIFNGELIEIVRSGDVISIAHQDCAEGFEEVDY